MRSVFQNGLTDDVFCGLRDVTLELTVPVDDVEYKSVIISYPNFNFILLLCIVVTSFNTSERG